MSRVEGFDSSLNLLEVLLWPFNDAVRLQTLLELKQDWYNANQQDFWDRWRVDVFDLRTANDFGLSVWSIILDLPLSFEAPPSDVTKIAFGFGPQRKNFNNGNFKRRIGGSVNLTTEQKRIALRLRYFQLITSGNMTDVNKFLLELFGPNDGLVYVRDNLDMTITYVFTFNIPSQLRLVIDEFDLLPRPDGVGFDYTVDLLLPFGFENRGNFDNSNFAPEVEPPPEPEPTGVEFSLTGQSSGDNGGFLAAITGIGGMGQTARGYSLSPGVLDASSTPSPIALGEGFIAAYALLELDSFPSPNEFYVCLFITGTHAQDYIASVIDPDAGTLLSGDADFFGINDGSISEAIAYVSTYWCWSVGAGSENFPAWLEGASPFTVEVTV